VKGFTGQSQVGIIPIFVYPDGRVIPCCTFCSRLPTSACACKRAPYVPCCNAFIIIYQQRRASY